MKVLMTADTVGGVWTYALELTRAMPEIDFVLATMGPAPSSTQAADLPPNVKLVNGDFKLEWMDDPWRDVVSAGAWLLDLESREAPDLVHLNGYAHGALPFSAPKIVVAHSCVISWWRAVKSEEAPPEWNTYRETVTRGLAGADLVVAPSAWMLGALDEHYKFATRRKLIYNGRSSPWRTGASPVLSDDSEADRRGRLSSTRNSVFAAGRMWDEAKNLRAVADAAPHINAEVRIAGDGSPLGRLDEQRMAWAYAESAIYLFPALYEPFGLSILEAALAGFD